MKKRTIFACAFIALLFVILIGRLVYFSVFKNNIYKRQVLSQQNYSSETLPYKRGDILDRDGNILATSQKMYTLILEPKNILRSDKIQKETINALHKYMKIDKDELLKFIKNIRIHIILCIKMNLPIVILLILRILLLLIRQIMSQELYLVRNTTPLSKPVIGKSDDRICF